jgi:hypothetical protein
MANDSNPLIITGKKSKSTDESSHNTQQKEKRRLSKKERKKLEKVLERKSKTLRVTLIEETSFK